MSEYVLYSDGELDDVIKDKDGLTAKDRKSIFKFTKESNSKMSNSIKEVSYNQYIHLLNNRENLDEIRYNDQNHATYTLRDFEDKVNECHYVQDYFDFNKDVRKIIEILDSQLKQHKLLQEELALQGVDYEIPLLIYKNNKSEQFTFSEKQLAVLKGSVGYSKNNCKELDQDIVAIYREWFKPIYFSRVTRAQEFRREMDLDFMDREHISGLIKASCLTGQFGKFDEYVEKLDKLVKQTNLTELELQIYDILRKGKGLDLDKVKYDENMVSITECSRTLKVSEPRGRAIFSALVDKVLDKYEEQYEDYYFTHIARGSYKTCSKCGEVKLANERYYGWDKTNSRWKSQCKKCILESKSDWKSVKTE